MTVCDRFGVHMMQHRDRSVGEHQVSIVAAGISSRHPIEDISLSGAPSPRAPKGISHNAARCSMDMRTVFPLAAVFLILAYISMMGYFRTAAFQSCSLSSGEPKSLFTHGCARFLATHKLTLYQCDGSFPEDQDLRRVRDVRSEIDFGVTFAHTLPLAPSVAAGGFATPLGRFDSYCAGLDPVVWPDCTPDALAVPVRPALSPSSTAAAAASSPHAAESVIITPLSLPVPCSSASMAYIARHTCAFVDWGMATEGVVFDRYRVFIPQPYARSARTSYSFWGSQPHVARFDALGVALYPFSLGHSGPAVHEPTSPGITVSAQADSHYAHVVLPRLLYLYQHTDADVPILTRVDSPFTALLIAQGVLRKDRLVEYVPGVIYYAKELYHANEYVNEMRERYRLSLTDIVLH